MICSRAIFKHFEMRTLLCEWWWVWRHLNTYTFHRMNNGSNVTQFSICSQYSISWFKRNGFFFLSVSVSVMLMDKCPICWAIDVHSSQMETLFEILSVRICWRKWTPSTANEIWGANFIHVSHFDFLRMFRNLHSNSNTSIHFLYSAIYNDVCSYIVCCRAITVNAYSNRWNDQFVSHNLNAWMVFGKFCSHSLPKHTHMNRFILCYASSGCAYLLLLPKIVRLIEWKHNIFSYPSPHESHLIAKSISNGNW